MQHRKPEFTCASEIGIVFFYGSAYDYGTRCARKTRAVLWMESDSGHAQPADNVKLFAHVAGAVGAGHLAAFSQEHLRQRAHTHPGSADQVIVPCFDHVYAVFSLRISTATLLAFVRAPGLSTVTVTARTSGSWRHLSAMLSASFSIR